ncbi:MAG: glycosyltransferase family 4 protein [Alphaproteobacteria bacterium]|nr:glycosyltransferase family 4 protein [Alphaproteobacteria bacterium]
MRILVLTDRFTPEVSAASTRIHAHAKLWQQAGHEPIIITCVPNFPCGEVFPGYRNRSLQEETVDGLRVLRLWTYMAPNEGVFRRVFDYVSYTLTVILQCWRLPKSDVILATSPPIFVAVAGWALSKLRRTPWVFEVRDLWPASIRAVGVSKSGVLNLVEAMELGLYRSAARVIVLTDPFKIDLTSRGIDPAKIDVVTNATDVGDVAPSLPVEQRAALRARFGLAAESIVVGFVGTLGMAQGAMALVHAAERLRTRSDIEFLVIGQGAERAAIEKAIHELGLRNIRVHNFVPQPEVANILAMLDIGAVVLKDDPVFHTVIPSKIFELFAASRPIVAAVEGEARRIIEDAAGGRCVAPEDGAAMAEMIGVLADDPHLRQKAGENGFAAVKAKYSRTAMAARALDTLGRAAGKAG